MTHPLPSDWLACSVMKAKPAKEERVTGGRVEADDDKEGGKMGVLLPKPINFTLKAAFKQEIRHLTIKCCSECVIIL